MFDNYRQIEQDRGAPAIRINKEKYWYLLEVLPPAKWTRRADSESFYMIEALTGNIHQWIARIGENYFTLAAPCSLNHDAIIARVKTEIIEA